MTEQQRLKLLGGGGCLLAVLLTLKAPIPDAVAWQLWISRQLLAGFHLYTDIAELNPPLWFWMAEASTWVGDRLGLAPVDAWRGFVLLFGLKAWALSWLASSHLDPVERRRWWLAIWLAIFGAANVTLGQRETMALTAALPYMLLLSRRREALPTPLWLSLSIGLLAASGFALKPYFLLMPIALEVWLILRLRVRWCPWRPELVAQLLAGLAYTIAVLLYTPAFLHAMVGRVGAAYGHYELSRWDLLLSAPMIALGFSLGLLRRLPTSAPMVGLALITCMSALGMLVQAKGFFYQSMGIYMGVIMITGLVWQQSNNNMPNRLAAGLILVACGAKLGLYAYAERQSIATLAAQLSAQAGPGGSIGLISGQYAKAMTSSQIDRLGWSQRYLVLWTAPVIAQGGRAAALLRRELVDDLTCQPPTLLLIGHAAAEYPTAGLGFDYKAFFRSDPRFANLFAHYRRGADIAELEAWHLSSPLPARPGCHPFDRRSIYDPA